MKVVVPVLLTLLLGWFLFIREDVVRLGPGIHAPETPLQERIESPESFEFKDYTVTPLASFQLEAKVLSRKNYSWGREADLSPLDIAFGWGKMSDEAVLDELDISQSSRWYSWYATRFPIPRREIETHSANMHLIPADSTVAASMDRARKGEIVSLTGSLVKVQAKDGWHWNSSLTRGDTGAGACEVIFVESFEVVLN